MKKIIETIKNVNKIGLVLILIAVGLITTQSAFKSKRAMVLWGKDASQANGWKNLTGISESSTSPFPSNSYRCNSNLSNICSAEFDSDNPPVDETSIPDGSTRAGDFVYTP